MPMLSLIMLARVSMVGIHGSKTRTTVGTTHVPLPVALAMVVLNAERMTVKVANDGGGMKYPAIFKELSEL